MLQIDEHRQWLARVGMEHSDFACYRHLWAHLVDQLHRDEPLTEYPVGGSKSEIFTNDLSKVFIFSALILFMAGP